MFTTTVVRVHAFYGCYLLHPRGIVGDGGGAVVTQQLTHFYTRLVGGEIIIIANHKTLAMPKGGRGGYIYSS